MNKRRVLVWADSPTVATGFAQVSRNILKELYATGLYEFDMVGINFDGAFDREKFDTEFPYINKIIPARSPMTGDMFGRDVLLSVLNGSHPVLFPPYDILFTIQDHFIIGTKAADSNRSLATAIKEMQKNTLSSKEHKHNHFVWVGYFPVDGRLKQEWVTESIALSDFPVAYCDYGLSEMIRFDTKDQDLEKRTNVIYHGTNVSDFYPLPPEKRRELKKKFLGKLGKEDSYLLVNVNRNQPRKDLFRTLQVYKAFKEKVPSAFLYLHCNPNDVGGNIFDMAKMIGLELGDFAVPRKFNPAVGYPLSVVNEVYNMADAVISTSLGEGWGLSITEAMACKTPIYAPAHTSIKEIFGLENEGQDLETMRGIPFYAGTTDTEYICLGRDDNEVPRPITNVESAVKALVWGYENPSIVRTITENAYTWAQEHTWANENRKWTKVFEEACLVNDQLRILNVAPTSGELKLGRNNLCPECLQTGISKKIKKCKLHQQKYL